ncbi:MAG: hypothetical protein OEL79_08315, partial [Chromatiales bacterium]|nr:hypothetical protein [Chromatiales bacterium]
MAHQSERRDAFRIDDQIYLDIVADGVEKKGLVDEKLSTHLSTLRELNFQSNHLLATIRKSNPEFAQYLA